MCDPLFSLFLSAYFNYRKLTGLQKEDVYCNLRIPDQFQTTKDDINIVILAGWCFLCRCECKNKSTI